MGKNSEESDPFARLEQTHRRLEERLAELLASTRALGDPDAARRMEARAIIEETIGFFGRGGLRHVQDEEETLFPRARRFAETAALMKALEDEHRDHQAIEGALRALIERSSGADFDRDQEAELARLARALTSLYEAHIAREEKELFPLCRKLLSESEIRAMGEEMMARRPDRGKR
jgi:hemerythrin-like domain-containing protein